MKKKEINFNKVKKNIFEVLDKSKEVLKDRKVTKTISKAFKNKKVLKAGLSFLVITFIFLGFSMKWSCTDDGLSCSGGYTPPDPNDVKKIINLKEGAPVGEVKK